jgi:hypothetical protein
MARHEPRPIAEYQAIVAFADKGDVRAAAKAIGCSQASISRARVFRGRTGNRGSLRAASDSAAIQRCSKATPAGQAVADRGPLPPDIAKGARGQCFCPLSAEFRDAPT